MAAPNSTIWGSTVGGYGRIGIYRTYSRTDTEDTLTVEIWFWSKYSVSDSSNTLYHSNLASSGSATTSYGSYDINTTVASGVGWSTSNQVLLGTFDTTHKRGTAAQIRYLYAKLTNVDRVGGTMYVSTTHTVPALAKYTVSYNANGGSGAPASQTKTHGVDLTLSSAKPTQTGNDFTGWATAANGSIAYQPGAKYTANASVTLYAKWSPHTYTITYNANGGSGAPAAQLQSHNRLLTLSSTVPTRENYTFKGWSRSSVATTAEYLAGDQICPNASITLYAVWELNYIKPTIFNFTVERCYASGETAEDGTNALVKFDWKTTVAATEAIIKVAVGSTFKVEQITLIGQQGSVSHIFGESSGSVLSNEASYHVEVIVRDNHNEQKVTTTLPSSLFTIDFYRGGTGAAFGKVAEYADRVQFGWDGEFLKPVYGKALGLDRVTKIPANSDLNNYLDPGCFAVYSDADATTILNSPVVEIINNTLKGYAGRFEVWAATGEGVRLQQWSYLRQRYISRMANHPVWERVITRGTDNNWSYGAWYQSSLAQSMSSRIYEKAGITVGLSANVTNLVDEDYAKVPFDKEITNANSDKLNLYINSGDWYVLVGDGVSRVKVSGQILYSCKSTGNRHVKIQRVLASGGVSTVSWVCVNAAAVGNVLCSLSPMIIPVSKGDKIQMVYYTIDGGADRDHIAAGSSGNGYQSYLTIEEF